MGTWGGDEEMKSSLFLQCTLSTRATVYGEARGQRLPQAGFGYGSQQPHAAGNRKGRLRGYLTSTPLSSKNLAQLMAPKSLLSPMCSPSPFSGIRVKSSRENESHLPQASSSEFPAQMLLLTDAVSMVQSHVLGSLHTEPRSGSD